MSRRSQSGNVFFALLAAVGLVGVLGASLTTFITGPAATMVTVTNKSKADTQMQISTRLAVVEAVHQGSGGDCDDDGTIEPLPPQDAGSSPAPLGGGHLPAALGAAQLDPWGTPYGYCAWNHGALNADNGCSANLLAGTNYPDARTRTALAIISAGPDRRFDTMCGPHPVYVDRNGDDLVMAYTYAEAIEASGGLWVLKSGEPSTATINRDVEVQGAFRMGIAGETQGTVGAGACTSPEHINRMRYNSFDEKIEVCSFVSPNYVWRPISSLELWTLHENQQDIFYTGGNVGIGTADPEYPLSINRISSGRALKLHGVASDAYMNIQDGTGRVNMYWNTTGGTSPMFARGGEHALNVKMHTNLSGVLSGYLFNFANGGDAVAGDPIEWTTLMQISNSGNVGIGTTAPASKLHVHHESAAPVSWQDGAITVTNSHAPAGMLALGNGTQAANTFLPMLLGYPVGNRATMVISEILPDDDDASHAWPAMSFQARVAGSPVSAIANRALFDWRNVNTRLMTITSNGNVGIGVTDPAQLLTLKYPGNSPRRPSLKAHGVQGDFYLNVQDGTGRVNWLWNTTGGGNPVFARGGENAFNFKIHPYVHSSLGGFQFNFADGSAAAAGDPITWSTLMRINVDGNVGIGINPQEKLHVNGTIQVPGMWLGKSGDVSVAPDIHMNAQGLIAADSNLHLMADGNGSGIGDIMFRAGALITPGSDLLVRIMRNGDTIIYGSGTTCTIGNSTGATMCSSDARLKQDVETVSDALENISSLRGVRFRWNDTARFEDKDKHHLGFIAQEIKEIFPEAVEEDEEGFLMVASGALIPPLVEAVKELKVLFDRLMKKLEALFDRVNMLALHNDRQDAIIAEQAAIIAGLETANRDVLYRLEKLEAAYPESCH